MSNFLGVLVFIFINGGIVALGIFLITRGVRIARKRKPAASANFARLTTCEKCGSTNIRFDLQQEETETTWEADYFGDKVVNYGGILHNFNMQCRVCANKWSFSVTGYEIVDWKPSPQLNTFYAGTNPPVTKVDQMNDKLAKDTLIIDLRGQEGLSSCTSEALYYLAGAGILVVWFGIHLLRYLGFAL